MGKDFTNRLILKSSTDFRQVCLKIYLKSYLKDKTIFSINNTAVTGWLNGGK